MAPPGSIGRTSCKLLLMPMIGWAVLAGVGYWPTRSLSGAEGLEAMFLAQGLVAAVVYLTLVPAMRRMMAAETKQHLQIGMKAGVTRFLLTLIITGVILWRGMANATVLLIWVAIAYVIMIKVETLALVYWMKRLEKRTC